ncbi:MAG: restriction endonuclease subunit S [Enterococcus canintestini]|uniref:restriction endonuclease subunit S n=1 Tax=Enterococcus canintestini TaxID=317010 RepID=UPI0039932034
MSKKKPTIRFKGFDNDWEQRKLGEVADIFDGTHQTPKYVDMGVKFVSVENIVTLETKKYISQDAYNNEYSKKQAEKGDILMTRIGDIGTTKVIETDESLAYYVTLALLKPKDVDSNFLTWVITSPETQRNIWKRTLHIAFPKKINLGEINQVEVNLPLYEEQTKIGGFFKQLDDTITLHQQQLENLKKAKKGYLQKMFPKNNEKVPEIRFEGFTDDWEQRKLGEVTDSYSGGTPSANNQAYYGGTIPFIRSAEINSSQTELFLTDNGLKESSSKMVEVGDILYALYGATSGEVGISQINGAINQAILAIQPKRNYDSQFIMQWLRLQKQSIIDKYLQGGQGNLSGSIVKRLEIYFPNYEEQQKIGAFFKLLDDTITLHQRKLDYLKEMKKGLLQKMFV